MAREMNTGGFYARIEEELAGAKRADLSRILTEVRPRGHMAYSGGKKFVNLSGNDYLGLMADDGFAAEFIDREGMEGGHVFASTGSRLITGGHALYAPLEADLEAAYGRPALAVNSGYHANVGILPALSGPGDLILSDELNHASIIDGVRLSKAERATYPHLDYEALERAVHEGKSRHRNIFIVTESVFSMDGDVSDLKTIAEIGKRHGAVTLVDEAHGVGVFGERGLGVSEERGVTDGIDIIIGTFGKAYSSYGAYAVMNGAVREYLVNKMRTLLFSTALPPVVVAWSRYVFGRSLYMGEKRTRLLTNSERLRRGLIKRGHRTMGGSQIVPLVVGESGAALKKAADLKDRGFLVFPIRPPTVPEGTSRIRFSLNAALGESEIDRLTEAVGP